MEIHTYMEWKGDSILSFVLIWNEGGEGLTVEVHTHM